MGVSQLQKAGTIFCSLASLVLAEPSTAANDRTMIATQAGKLSTLESALPAKRCGNTEIARSTCMIELILADLKAHYDGIGGGGITRITAGGSLSYAVELPQGERSNVLTYQFERRGDEIVLKSKTPSVISY